MLYLSRGYETNKLEAVETELSDFDCIVSSKLKVFPGDTSIEEAKKQSFYFIAGEVSRLVRKNETVLNKTLVVLDYDNLEITEEEFKSILMNKISVLKFYAYPSLRNQIAGTRYRLILPTDRPYTKEESKQLITFVTDHIGLQFDESSATWSQLQGFKASYEGEESYAAKCIYNEGRGLLKVDNALNKMAERSKKPKEKESPVFTVNHTRKRKFTASFMAELFEGVDEGNRDNWITKQFGRMLSLGFTHVEAYEWIELINREFVRPPVTDDDLHRIVVSISKKENEQLKKA